MSVSLLFPEGKSKATDTSFAERLSADLMLDESFSYITADITKRRYFLSVLADVQPDPDIPLYRAEILRDFCSKPNLLEGLCIELRQLSELRDDQQAERSRFYSVIRSTDSESAFVTAAGIAEVSSAAARKTLKKLAGIGELLRIYTCQSRGLTALRERVAKLTTGPKFEELCELLGHTSSFGMDATYKMRAELNGYARIASYELTGITRPTPAEEVSGLKRLFAKKPNGAAHISGVRVDDKWGVLQNDVLSGAMREIAELAHSISQAVFDEFLPLLRELCFYEVAAAYVEAMRKKRLPLCYPELTSDGPARYEELYDLFLCASYIDAGSVVPNDADLSHGGILVTGANNTGKTVFLRSVGTAQLLAQAGLPIIAKSATVRMRCGVYSLYAAAEKEFAPGVDAGRFEQEVRLVAEMLKSIKPGALVLINELFQTTSYPEGAEGLCGILRYLRSDVVGADFIAVTHLTDLIDMMAGETVHMRTLEGENLYKLEKVTRSYWRGIGC